MYVVAFYASVIPIALVITCFALFLHYWVEKYNIAKRRTIKYNYSS
jgi:heme/copper-type cytochrome/quinol oxidase subunit 1